MKKVTCDLCGNQIDDDDNYSYNNFLNEDLNGDCSYCSYCKQILRSKIKKRPRKVKIVESDYHLPGFIRKRKGKHYYYVRPRKKNKNRKRGSGYE